MNKRICKTVNYILPLYLEGRVNQEQKYEIERHLIDCPECFDKFCELKRLKDTIRYRLSTEEEKYLEREFCRNNLSAFIDNELSKEDYFRVANYIAESDYAKKELDDLVKFENFLQQSIEEKKEMLNNDFSKSISRKMSFERFKKKIMSYSKIAAILALIVIVAGLTGYFISLSNSIVSTKTSEIPINFNLQNQ